MKRNNIYQPLLAEFGSAVRKYSRDIDISGPFLPHVLSQYETSIPKYFYCGQDTCWWIEYSKFINAIESNRLEEYLSENDKWLSADHIKKNSGNKEGSFWTMVVRLHLFLRTNRLYSLSEISPAEDKILEEIGWGSLNAIEVPTTLHKEGRWDSLDQNAYWQIKQESRKLDSIKLLIEAFSPDIIFIFTWDDLKKADAFQGLNVTEDLSKAVGGLLAIYSISGYDTKIVWCPHPNNLRYKAQSIDSLIQVIANALS